MYAMIPVFDRVPATNQISQPIPAHYARAGTCIASYSGAAAVDGTVKVQASHDTVWVDLPNASTEVSGAGSYLVSWEAVVAPLLRVISETSAGGQNEIQSWDTDPDDWGTGTFTVSDGQTTSTPVNIELLDGPALLIAALEEVYGAGNIGWPDGEAIRWEFKGALANQSVPLTIFDTSQLESLSGGAVSDTVVREQAGGANDPGTVTATVFLSGSRS